MSKKGIKIAKYIVSLALFAIVIYMLNKFNIFKGYSPSDVKAYLNSYGIYAPIIYIIMFTLVPLTLFPDSILAISGGIAFGLVRGSIYTMIGALCGGTLSFYIARLLGRNFVKKLIGNKLAKVEGYLKKNAFFIILLLRLVPLFPFDVISYSAGLSDIKFRDFIFATSLGTIPGILVYTNLGDKSTEIGSTNFYISVALLILLFIASVFLKKKIVLNTIEDKKQSIDIVE